MIDSHEKVDLDQRARGLPETINNYIEYRPYSIPTCQKRPEEPELKFIIPHHYKAHQIYAALHALHKGKNSNITLADDGIIARDPLVSFILDTPQFDIMRATREQLRVRGPISMVNHGHEDPTQVIWRGQATVKTLFSDAAGVGKDRVEIEASIPSQDIRFAFDHFIKYDQPNLDDVFYALSPEELRVAAICITTRASFNTHVYVPQYDAYVEFENCCDPNYFLTPNADVRAGKDLEFEAEAKKIYARPELGFTTAQKTEIYELAKAQYKDFILTQYPDFVEAQYSKAERATRAVGRFYHDNHDGNLVGEFNTTQFVAELPYSHSICLGMAYAMRQDVSIWDAVKKANDIAAIAKKMIQPTQVIPANNALCSADDRSKIRLRAA